MSTTSKPLAVVTGASSGIGYELARQFAMHGHDLLVCAEDGHALQDAARMLGESGAAVQSVQADLSSYEGVEALWSAIQATGRPVAACAVNAGVGLGGRFVAGTGDGTGNSSDTTALEDELRLVQLNVASTVHLAKRVLPGMAARREGRVLFTASIAGTMPTPFEAVYGASKAFVLSFSESLREELRDTGVTVTALLPGPTDTNFFHRAGMDDTEVGSEGKEQNSAEDVARMGYEALMAGKDKVVAASLMTKLEGVLNAVLPDTTKAARHAKQSAPGSAG